MGKLDNMNDKFKVKKAAFFVKNGNVSEATNIMFSNGVWTMSELVKKQLKSKHPFEEQYKITEEKEKVKQMKFQLDDLINALSSIKKITSHGWK